MSAGYIKLYRASLNDPLYLKEPFTKWQAWCDLILLAYFAPSEFFVRGIKVKAKRGCVYKGSLELAERWKWSRGKVDRFISYLETDKRVSVQKNNVIGCITIINYDKYQQNDTTNETPNSTANDTTNEHLIRRFKEEDNNIFKPDSQNREIGFGEEPLKILQKMQEELAELKERIDSQERKPSKKKEPNPLITKGRERFEKRYSDLFSGSVYYWQAKDAVAMDALTKKIIHSRKQKGMGVEQDEVLDALEKFLESISDPWLLKNFSVTNINSKYNEIVAQAKANITKINSNGTNQSNKEARAKDAASIIARLAEEEGNDDSPVRR